MDIENRPDPSTNPTPVTAAKPARNKWIVIAGGAVGFIVISILAFLLVSSLLLPKFRMYQIRKSQAAAVETATEGDVGHIYVLDGITVNLMDKQGRRIMVAEYAIESRNEKVIEEIRRRVPQLRDEFIRYLRQHTAEEVLAASFQETSKADLTKILNSYLTMGEIDNMYYNQLILQ